MSLQSKTFADLVNFSRASTATYVDADGTIKTSAVDAPRFGYSTGRRALLLEPSATNLLQRSQDLSLWPWANDGNRLTITEDSGVAPDGSVTATLLVSNAGDGLHRVVQMLAPTLGTSYTFSVYLKAAGTRYVYVNCSSMLNAQLAVDLTTGAYVSTGPGPFAVTALPNGWWRVSLTGVAAVTNNGVYLQANTSLDAEDQPFVGDGTSGFYGWGAQLEVGATATSYIPTAASAVTRAADFAAIKGLAAGTYDRRRVTASGTVDTKGIVHPGGDIALPAGAYYQSIYYPGGTL